MYIYVAITQVVISTESSSLLFRNCSFLSERSGEYVVMKRKARFKCLIALLLGLAMGLGSTQLTASQGEPGDFPLDPAGLSPGPGPGGGSGVDQSPGRIRDIEERFATSLHNTRKGKESYYSAVDGFEQITGVPYDNLSCKNCHDKNLVPDWQEPTCTDCHLGAEDGDYTPPDDNTCLGCHGRQNAEHNMFADVHRDEYGMVCMDCHTEEEVHGDGNVYESMLEAGVFKVSCADAGCHQNVLQKSGKGNAASGKASQRAKKFHQKHLDTVDCSACHTESVIACDSCHFDTEVAGVGKRFYRNIPQTGFKLLLNHQGKVRTATYQSLTWGTSVPDVEDAGFYVLAPYVAHTVTRADDLECNDCHVKVKGKSRIEGNAAMKEYLETGQITVNQWDADAGEGGMLMPPTGIIPVPPDWRDALLFDFVYYLGDVTDSVVMDPAGTTWGVLEPETVGTHMPYGTPLTEEQMDRLISGGGQ